MSNAFIDGFFAKMEELERTDPLQKANLDMLQLVSEAMIGKVSGQEYELRMLEVKTRIAILERDEKKNGFVHFPVEENHASVALQTPRNIAPVESQQVTKIYGENWIVLQNRLLNAISDLDLNERRLIMFLSPLVRKVVDINPNQRTFVVKVQDFQTEYGIKSNRYYEELEKSCIALTDKSYMFWDFGNNRKKPLKTHVSWLTKSVYQQKVGEVHVDLHDDVVEMLTVFDKANPFTKYERQMIVNLGSYGMILFELIASCMHQQHKQKTYTVEYLREKFNCVETYPQVGDFKLYVLNRAIKDIHKHTPYRISYTQNKKGRKVSEIVFSFEDATENALEGRKEKAETRRDLDTLDMLAPIKMTDKQRLAFAKKLSKLPELEKYATGEAGRSYEAFAEKIANDLLDEKKSEIYRSHLEKLGFKF